MSSGYVYVLKTRSYPHLKIGCTTRTPEERAAELSGTGLPHPFKVAYSVAVDNCHTIERLVHEHFAGQRVADNREFFTLTVADAIRGIDEIVRTTAPAAGGEKPKCEEEPKNKTIQLPDRSGSQPPHNTHLPTNRFAEDTLYYARFRREQEIVAKYPLIHSSLNIHHAYNADPEQSGDWTATCKNLWQIARDDYGLHHSEHTLEARIKEGYGIRRGVGYITKRGIIHAQLYQPGTAPLSWFKIYPSFHTLCSAARAMQGPDRET